MKLAHKYKENIHIPHNCLITEKLDGMRGRGLSRSLLVKNAGDKLQSIYWLMEKKEIYRMESFV